MITFGYREAEDLLAALDLVKSKGCHRIACLGVSQGGATILFAADRLRGIECAVCESSYDDMAHAVDNRFRHYLSSPAWLFGCLLVPFAESRCGVAIDQLRPIDGIGKLACPLLIISGLEDEKTRPEDTERLFAAARDPKELWMVPGIGHRDLFAQKGYPERIADFLRKHIK